MKSLLSYIYEAQIDGLKDVKIIRHYTTGSALKSILKSGYIEARESQGDSDWEGYDLYDYKVVSFHDARLDPERDTFIDCNNAKLSMDGYTPTLGLHCKKVCACIEIDYEKLPKLIQDRTHLLNIYKKKAEEFVNCWNRVMDSVKNDDGFVVWTKCKLEFTEFVKSVIKGDDEELKKSLKFIWNPYDVNKLIQEKEAKLVFTEIEKIFLKYYTKEKLYEPVKDLFHNDTIFIYDEISTYMRWGFGYGFPEIKQVNDTIDDLKKQISFYSRKTFKKFTDDEVKELAEYAVTFNWIAVIKMMKEHGWEPGDKFIGSIFMGGKRRYQRSDGVYEDTQLMLWIEYIQENPNKLFNTDIEIRIPANVELNKENCKIIIFDGICEATEQEYLINLPKKYYEKYNIEHVKPKNKNKEQ